MSETRSKVRAMQLRNRKANESAMRVHHQIPKVLVQHARRYGSDIHSIVADRLKYRF